MFGKKKKNAMKGVEARKFSPALQAAIAMVMGGAQEHVKNIIGAEAQNLKLPEGWQANLQQGVWMIPTDKASPTPPTSPQEAPEA